MGLDVGVMWGFDVAKVDVEFSPDSQWRTNCLLNLCKADPKGVYPRGPRSSFVLCLAVGSYVMSLWWGITGIWLAYIADEWVRGFLAWQRWRTGGWWSSARASARYVRHR